MSENTTGDRTTPEAESDAAADRIGEPAPETTDAPDDETTDAPDADAIDNSPPIPDEIREAARLAPDHWLSMIDPTWTGQGEPPDWAVVGRWRSSLEGEIVEWQDNPDYKPSPRALGWPDPEDDVDGAVQLAVTGYGPAEAVPKALADYEVAVLTSPGGGLVTVTTPDDVAALPLYTSPVYLHTSGRFGFELMRVDRELLDKLPAGHVLYINPSGPVAMTLEPDAVRKVLDDYLTAGRTVEQDRTAPAEAPAPPPMITTSSDTPAVPGASDDPTDATDGADAPDTPDGAEGEEEAQGSAEQVRAILGGDTPRESEA